MGYQALLFCPDEKLARIVAQVFTELEFNVETVQEPFSAVKKLMAQRYAALVVDCENESNASLLFKSARNSSSNQGILAIAVVEGQAGVAKAYRIGANLVLTKPINIEQAKGTLRVARGLLRKSSEGPAAAPSQPTSAARRADEAPVRTAAAEIRTPAAPVIPAITAPEAPQVEPALPALAASAADAAAPMAIVPEAPAMAAAATEALAVSAISKVKAEVTPMVQPALPAPAATSVNVSASTGQGTAAAPAKVKEFVPATRKSVETEPAESTHVVFPPQESETVGSTPTFSALEAEDSGTSGRGKKILVAAVVLLAVAALGYFGWTKFGSHSSASTPAQPVSAAQPSSQVPAPVERPAIEALRADATKPASAASQPAATSPAVTSPAGAKASKDSMPRIEVDSAAETKGPSVAPLVVKSKPNKQAKATTEDAPAPGPLALGGASTSTLSNLVAASSTPAPQVSLATLKISQGVSQGLLIKRVDPKYPPSALAMHVQGAVLLDATINREGQISNVKVVKGDKVLARAAADAVKQWRYKPYYLDGQPVEIETQITVNFKLPN
jgi:protein TonB